MSKTIEFYDDVTHHVKCNNIPRPLYGWHDLTNKAQDDFDYLPNNERDANTARFFEYRGSWYDLHDGFDVASSNIKSLGFDAVQGESYFSAVAVRYFDRDGYLLDGGDSIVVGYIHW
jgi:hypothetical protein